MNNNYDYIKWLIMLGIVGMLCVTALFLVPMILMFI